MNEFLLPGAIAVAVTSWLGVGLMRRWAEWRSILDHPNDRSSHTRPTPRGGGLVIAVLVLAAGMVGLWWVRDVGAWVWATWGASAALVAVVSWVDDLRGLSFAVRLLVHFIAASAFVAVWLAQGGSPLLRGEAWFPSAAVALLWVVGLTNAYNFMDGIDGIAGGQAVVTGLAYAAAGYVAGAAMQTWMGLASAAASLGFLGHNWPPARIFMGDVGSAFLGFSFAAMALIATAQAPGVAVVGLLSVWPFVFDTSFTFLRRLRRRENVFSAHRSHLYQRLVIAGWGHATVSALYIGLGVLGASLGATALQGGRGSGATSFGGVLLVAAGLWGVTVLRERAARSGGKGAARA
jgi:UDP-N-acetylmuramyl pentapeptide phosphotransferase/UDP-N-acetylglucosamine-1-phosphate transferase